MKLTIVLLIGTLLQVSATSLAQKITFVQKDATIKQVFDQVYKQTGYSILWPAQNLQADKKINANFHNTPLEDVLKKIFEKQALDYTIEEKTIVIKDKEPPVVNTQAEIASKDTTLIVTGLVVENATGLPLAGATVKVKNGKIATTTNKDGVFKLSGVDAKATLVVSFVGNTNIEIRAAQSLGIIRLKLNDSPLNEIQVIAYGTESKRFTLGSVATVSGETIRSQPVMNPLLALQGQVAGLAVNPINTGVPGGKVFLQIRGQNTFSKGYNEPLFIIDGIPFARQNTSVTGLTNLTITSNQQPQSSLDQGSGLSAFNNINPDDIESISVLKDADATSIYGSEGSNGVILITTRRGAAGKIVFNTNIQTQFNTATQQVKFLNTAQYLQLRRDAFAADGLVPSSNPTPANLFAPDLTLFDQTKYTDWQKVILGNTTNNTNVNTSLSGGTGNNNFRLSTGYFKSNVNYPGDYSNQRFTINGSFHTISNDKRLEVDFRSMYGYNTNTSPGSVINQNNILLPPNLPDLIKPDGGLNWTYNGLDISGYQFYATLNTFSKAQNANFQNSVQLSYKLLPGLRISANAGYNRNSSSENSGFPKTSRVPLSSALSTANFATSVSEAYNIEPQIDYKTNIGKGSLTALLGGTYKKNINSSFGVAASGYNNDGLLESITAAVTKTPSDGYNIRRYAAAFGRIQYYYAQKYLISLTGRRDGSSNFGPDHQFGNFASVAGGWIFSEENIVKKLIPFMSFGKLSTSYGTSGSDGVGQYQFQTFWSATPGASAFQGITPAAPLNHYNPDYSWSLKKSLNMAVDLGFLKDRILLNATYYRNRESDQLASSPLPTQTGFTSVTENVPSTVQNKGWEFGLHTKNIQSGSFTWESNFNLSFNRNVLLSFPNLSSSVSYRSIYSIGQPISYLGVYKYAGMDPATGLPQFYDRKGAITTTPAPGSPQNGGDYVANINRDPDYGGGLGNTFSYKQFRLDFFLQFNSQTAPNWLRTLYQLNRIGINANNVPVAVLGKYWTTPGQQTELLKLTSQSSSAVGQSWSNFLNSDAMYQKTRYVRLKTVALSYILPEYVIKKLHMKSGILSVNAQNLFVVSNVEVGDPESNGNYFTVPLQRIISFGANFNF